MMAAITDLSTASSVATGDYLVVSQSGTDKKVTANKFAIVGSANTFTAAQTFNAAVVAASIRDGAGSGTYTLDILSATGANVARLGLTGFSNGFTVTYQSSPAALIYSFADGSVLIGGLAGSGNRAVYSDPSGYLTNSSSDATLKRDVTSIEAGEALTIVEALRPVRYNWIDGERRGEQREIGLLAQDVRPHVPEVVGVNADGTLSLDYPKLTALLIGAVQELTARVAALEAKTPG